MPPRNRKQQRLARARMEKTGESYTTALRYVRAASLPDAEPTPPVAKPSPASLPKVGDLHIGANGLYSGRELRELQVPNRRWEAPEHREVERCKAWIQAHCRKTKRVQTKHSSYGLKHAVERQLRASRQAYAYVSNGAFIQAAHELGIEVSRVPGLSLDTRRDGEVIWRGSPNAYFGMSVQLPEDAWKRVRPAKFSRWLFRHLDEDSPTGDLARDAKSDHEWPRKSNEFNDFWRIVRDTIADETFIDAWESYTGQLAPLTAYEASGLARGYLPPSARTGLPRWEETVLLPDIGVARSIDDVLSGQESMRIRILSDGRHLSYPVKLWLQARRKNGAATPELDDE